jgi:hypothetical protein
MGRPALERGGVSPEGASSPQATRSFTRGVQGLPVLVGQDRGPLPLGCDCLGRVLRFVGRLCFSICERKWVSPSFLGDPYGCSRQ